MRSTSAVPNILQALEQLEEYVFEQVYDCVTYDTHNIIFNFMVYDTRIIIFNAEKSERLKAILNFNSFVNVSTVNQIILENRIENWVALWNALMQNIGIIQTQNSYAMSREGATYHIKPIFHRWFSITWNRIAEKQQRYLQLQAQLQEQSVSKPPASDPLVKQVMNIAEAKPSSSAKPLSSSTTKILLSFTETDLNPNHKALLEELERYVFNLLENQYKKCCIGAITDSQVAIALREIFTIENFTSSKNDYVDGLFKRHQIDCSLAARRTFLKCLRNKIGLEKYCYHLKPKIATIKVNHNFQIWFQDMQAQQRIELERSQNPSPVTQTTSDKLSHSLQSLEEFLFKEVDVGELPTNDDTPKRIGYFQ